MSGPETTSTEGAAPADERYRRLIEDSGVGLFQTKVDGSINWLNAAAARVLAYRSPEEFSSSIHDIRQIYVDPSRREDLIALLRRDRAVRNFEYEAKRRDRGTRWISITAKAILDENGDLEGFEGTFFDVTEKKLLEAATRAISSNLEPASAVAEFAGVLKRSVPFKQLSLAVIEGDGYRRVVSLSGDGRSDPLPKDEEVSLEGNSVGVVVDSGNPVVVNDTEAGSWPFDSVLHSKGIYSYAIFPLVDEEGVFATFNVGLAEKDGFDEGILSLIQVLISAATQAVKNILLYEKQREIVARLQDIDRVKNDFLAGVAHDLRNPVAVIGNAAELLESGWSTLPEERKLQTLQVIRRSAANLYTSLQRDLDLALIDQGELQYDLRQVDLRALVTEVVEGFISSEATRRFELSVPDDLPAVTADEGRQRQVLNNLLSNAVKFSPDHSCITVEISTDSGSAVVSITNEGPAIDDASKSKLFQRMSRLSTQKPGTGLGLFMSRAMVEAQGGRIWLEETTADTNRFSYTIPFA